MNKLEQDVQRVFRLICSNKEPSLGIKQEILQQRMKTAPARISKIVTPVVLTVIVAITAVWLESIKPKQTALEKLQPGSVKTNIQSSGNSTNSLIRQAAPIPFDYPVIIVADSYPAHPNETVIIQPTDKLWTGRSVKIYLMQDTARNNLQLLYRHVLPSDAKYIGSSEIRNGTWSFLWQAPDERSKDRQGNFLIAAQSDTGILSGTKLTTLPYKKLEITPRTAKTGQQIVLRGFGFLPGVIKVNISKETPEQGTVMAATLGMLHSNDGSFLFSFELGHEITPGEYRVEVITIPTNGPRELVFANLHVQ